jgi:serine/threonine protein kinase
MSADDASKSPPTSSGAPKTQIPPQESPTQEGLAAKAGIPADNGMPKGRGNTAPSTSGTNGPQGPPQIIANGRKKVYKIRGGSFETDARFEVIKAIGLGAYGLVCSAYDADGKRHVAIKKIPKLFDDLIDGKRVLREIKVMKLLRTHPNITELYHVMPPREETPAELAAFKDVYVVSELMDTDLHLILKTKQKLSFEHHAYFMYQLVKGTQYVHSAGVIHRDLKPGNLLLNSNCDVKLCDFGLARAGVPLAKRETVRPDYQDEDKPLPQLELTDYVITRWYRPPELLLLSPYNHAVDMWSIGCIMAEVLQRKALFQGRDYLHQLTLISEVVDVPKTGDELRAMLPNSGNEAVKFVMQLSQRVLTAEQGSNGGVAMDTKTRLARKFSTPGAKQPSAMTKAVDLIAKLLVFSPHKRFSALDAMRHPYFAHVYDKKDEMDHEALYGAPQPLAWEFDHRELGERDLRELFWKEMIAGVKMVPLEEPKESKK